MDAGVIAVISTLLGGVILKITEYFIKKSQNRDDNRVQEQTQRELDLAARESAVVTERISELARLRVDIDKLQQDLLASRQREDEYRNKFYATTEALLKASITINKKIERAEENNEEE